MVTACIVLGAGPLSPCPVLSSGQCWRLWMAVPVAMEIPLEQCSGNELISSQFDIPEEDDKRGYE